MILLLTVAVLLVTMLPFASAVDVVRESLFAGKGCASAAPPQVQWDYIPAGMCMSRGIGAHRQTCTTYEEYASNRCEGTPRTSVVNAGGISTCTNETTASYSSYKACVSLADPVLITMRRSACSSTLMSPYDFSIVLDVGVCTPMIASESVTERIATNSYRVVRSGNKYRLSVFRGNTECNEAASASFPNAALGTCTEDAASGALWRSAYVLPGSGNYSTQVGATPSSATTTTTAATTAITAAVLLMMA